MLMGMSAEQKKTLSLGSAADFDYLTMVQFQRVYFCIREAADILDVFLSLGKVHQLRGPGRCHGVRAFPRRAEDPHVHRK